jgi:hypothetical protein
MLVPLVTPFQFQEHAQQGVHQENPKLPQRPRKTKKDMKDAIVDCRLYRKVGGVDFAA